MDSRPLEAESTLTDRYQTTIPDLVRKALGVEKRDKIHYTIQPNGQVILTVAKQNQNDPVVEKFLSFLAEDLKNNPQHVQQIDAQLVGRIESLIAGVHIDLDASLSDEDE